MARPFYHRQFWRRSRRLICTKNIRWRKQHQIRITVITYAHSALEKDIYDQLMRSRFRLLATWAIEEKKIEALPVILPLEFLFPGFFIPQIVTYRLFYTPPPLFSFFARPYTLVDPHALLSLTEQ